jgi:hypothetical protein
LPRLDNFFDDLDALYSNQSFNSFSSNLDSLLDAEFIFLEGFLQSKKDEPKTETVTVTAPRPRGLSIGRPLPSGTSSSGFFGFLNEQQRRNIRANLKLIFGVTDAEIDKLVAQIQNSPTAIASLLRLGNIATVRATPAQYESY